MTTEHAEMVEVAQDIMEERGGHLWPMLQHALKAGDRGAAETVLEAGSSRLSAREKIAAQQAIKRTFPESPEAWKERQGNAAAGYRSEIGQALAQKLGSRRARQKKITEHAKPSIGWNVPPEEGVEYTTPGLARRDPPPSSFTSDTSRKGAGRAKVAASAYGRGGPAS